MPDPKTSLDEFMAARKDFTKGDLVIKAVRAPSSWDAAKRSMRFTMSVEIEDRDRDIIHQAGLDTDAFTQNPPAFFNHRSFDFPVGSWSDVTKVLNGRPKRTEGTLTLVKEGINEVADKLALHMDAGVIRACSIGFLPKEVKRREVPEDKRDSYYYPGYEILAADLIECSPVTIPANPAALAKMAQDGNVVAREIVEEVLDTWAKHPETGLIVPRAAFEQAHKEATGTRTTVVVPKALAETVSQLKEAADAVAAALQELAPADDDPATTKQAASDDTDTREGTKSVNDARSEANLTLLPDGDVELTVFGEKVSVGRQILPTINEAKQNESFLKRLFKMFGSTADHAIEAELREARLAEAQRVVDEAERRKAADQRFQALVSRAEAKGLV